jgi:phenylalanyl-tRNA synthetase beta chain
LPVNDIVYKESNEPFYLQNSGVSVYLKNELLGTFGRLDKKVLLSFDIDADVYAFDVDISKLTSFASYGSQKYIEPPKYPVVHRDISFLIKKDKLLCDIIKTIKEVNVKTIKNVLPFDVFEGTKIREGYRSLSLSITLGSDSKTLTDEHIKNIIDRVITRLTDLYSIEMR